MHGNWVRFPSMLANTVAWRNRLNSHPPVGVGRVVLHSRQRGDILVAWREMADRVGRAGVTGERERLAAAAAEIDLAPRTACARLLHPGGSAEGIEGRRIRPDVGERVLAYRPEFKTGNGLGRVAGQHLARRCHVQRAPPPAADAWLRKPRVIVGQTASMTILP